MVKTQIKGKAKPKTYYMSRYYTYIHYICIYTCMHTLNTVYHTHIGHTDNIGVKTKQHQGSTTNMHSQLQWTGVEGAQGLQKYCSTLSSLHPHWPTSIPQHLHRCIITGTHSTHAAVGRIVSTIAAASQVTFNLGCSTEPVLIYQYSPAPSIKPISNN